MIMVSNFDLNRTALNNQMMGLSTDTKPTTGILPNSLFWELDTNGMYYFDGTQWQSIGGSGGGGGGDDLIELEYTVANSIISLTKTPAELYELMQAGKNFKIVANSDIANYGQLSVGDEFISIQYSTEDDSLATLDFYLAPLPTNQGDTGGKWKGLFFGNENGVMEIALD